MSEEMNLYKRCKNIFKFHGVDMGGGGESAPEVENAIETHGLGWTDTEEKAGFDIQWDGDTEGLESLLNGRLCKVDSNLHGITSAEDLIGSTIFAISYSGEIRHDVTENDIRVDADGLISVFGNFVMVALSDVTIPVEDEEDINVSKGVWFVSGGEEDHVYRFYKEATTEEVVHQIDQKYIPDSEFTVVIDYNSIGSDTQTAYDEALTAFQAKKNVLLKKGDVYIPMTGYDSEHCFFGGTASAYLPGNIINAVYAHVGPNGNKFWWGYTIPLGANALSIADEDEHFTGTNVESALAELASRLDALESK